MVRLLEQWIRVSGRQFSTSPYQSGSPRLCGMVTGIVNVPLAAQPPTSFPQKTACSRHDVSTGERKCRSNCLVGVHAPSNRRRRMTFLSEILLVSQCLREVDRHFRFRIPASGAEKAFTVSHIYAQLSRSSQRNWTLPERSDSDWRRPASGKEKTHVCIAQEVGTLRGCAVF